MAKSGFPRPIRWLVSLLDDAILPITLENGSDTCASDRISQGHRALHPAPVSLSQADEYRSALESAYVLVDPEERTTRIAAQIKEAAQSVNGYPVISPALLAEVTHLVEWPTAVVGKFDPEFLALPPEVVTMEMESHQRYFPVRKSASSREFTALFHHDFEWQSSQVYRHCGGQRAGDPGAAFGRQILLRRRSDPSPGRLYPQAGNGHF